MTEPKRSIIKAHKKREWKHYARMTWLEASLTLRPLYT